MSNVSSKPQSDTDSAQAIQYSYNDVDKTITANGFLVGLVGRKVTLTITTTIVSNDTENYVFSENGTNLYTFVIVYTDGTRTVMSTATRTA